LVERCYARRPFATSFGLLALGMLAVMSVFAWDSGLALRQYLAVAATTVLLALLCTWIVFLENAEPGGIDGEPGP
jgi:hypothetical protein